MNGESIDIKQARLQRLKGLFPELFAENQVDWEKLKAAFGEAINFATTGNLKRPVEDEYSSSNARCRGGF